MNIDDPILPLLRRLGACREAREAHGEQTLREAVTTCRLDWLLWLGVYVGLRREVVGLVCDYAERVRRHEWGTDHPAVRVLALERRWAQGDDVSERELRDAARAAYAASAAADAAHTAAHAAACAAYAAAAEVAEAAEAAHAAARIAVRAAASDAYAAAYTAGVCVVAACASADDTERAWQHARAREILTPERIADAVALLP